MYDALVCFAVSVFSFHNLTLCFRLSWLLFSFRAHVIYLHLVSYGVVWYRDMQLQVVPYSLSHWDILDSEMYSTAEITSVKCTAVFDIVDTVGEEVVEWHRRDGVYSAAVDECRPGRWWHSPRSGCTAASNCQTTRY